VSNQFTFDVFLSYSSKDRDVVRDIAERLKDGGLNVWFDEWKIKPGDNIPHKIEEGLERSRVLLLCMSENAFGSDWARLESGTFRFRDPLNKERRFIPLRLDDAPIKGSLAQFLYIKWLPKDREQGYRKLLETCRISQASIVTEPLEAVDGWSVADPHDVVIDRHPRHDFPNKTKDTLARRVGMKCSNPSCRKSTSGPQTDPNRAINIGAAAHITAAAEDGPRYASSLSKRERSSIENGIWLCQNCAKLVDSDVVRFPVEALRQWKKDAEKAARQGIETSGSVPSTSRTAERTSVRPYATVARPKGECSILLRERLYRDDFEEGLVICPPAWDRVAETLGQRRIVAVQAPPGSGKSTLAAWVDWKLSQKTHVEYLPGRNFQNLGGSALADAMNGLPDETVVLLDDAHLVQRHLDYLMRSALAPRMRFLLLSRPGGFANIPGIPEPISLSELASSIAQEMVKRYAATPEEATWLLSESECDLVFTKWLLGAVQQNPSQRNQTLETTVRAKLKEFWDIDKEILRLVLVLSAYRWLELQCSIDSLTERFRFTTGTIETLTEKLREAGFDSSANNLFLDRHPKLAGLFHKAATQFRYYTVDVLKPTCAAFHVDHSALTNCPFGHVVLGLAVGSGSVRASDVVDRLLFSTLHADCAEFSKTAAYIEIQLNPAVDGLNPLTIERRLTISFAAYDAMRREKNEEQAWGVLTKLRTGLGVRAIPTTAFEKRGYLLYQVGYHYLLTNQLNEALRYLNQAAEDDDLWATQENSDIHFGKAAMSRIAAARAAADVLLSTSNGAENPKPDMKEIAAIAQRLDAERIRLEELIIGAKGMDWSWLQRWHLNALLHLAELRAYLGDRISVESLTKSAIKIAPVLGLATPTGQSAKLAQATLALYERRFEIVVDLLKDIPAAQQKGGERSGRFAQLLAIAYHELGNLKEHDRWCRWLASECSVDKANGPAMSWAKAVLKSRITPF
jgi:tetratricopeptide (TPR) repeat protein